jgi:hypothetical protein
VDWLVIRLIDANPQAPVMPRHRLSLIDRAGLGGRSHSEHPPEPRTVGRGAAWGATWAKRARRGGDFGDTPQALVCPEGGEAASERKPTDGHRTRPRLLGGLPDAASARVSEQSSARGNGVRYCLVQYRKRPGEVLTFTETRVGSLSILRDEGSCSRFCSRRGLYGISIEFRG